MKIDERGKTRCNGVQGGMPIMMGFKERTFAPLTVVSVEELVPQDHFYRHLHKVLDLSFVYDLVREHYSVAGRPSIDPIVFFKLQLVMFFEDIRSERLLMRQVADRLSVRWYVGYDLDELLPDHSTLSKIRTRYGLSVFRDFFEAVVEQCQKAKLIWGKDLYFDATKVEANASMASVKPRFAVEAHLAHLFAEEECSQVGQEIAPEKPAPPLLPTPLPETQQEELAATNAQRHDWVEDGGQPNREETHGSYRRVADYRVSTTDPDATIMPTKGQGFHLGYHTHYVVDGGKKRIILNVLVTPSEVMENQAMLALLWRTRFRWKLRPRQVTGDTTYGTLDSIQGVEDANIRAYMPLAEPGERNALLGSSHGRTIHRNLREHYSERVRAYHQTAAYEKAMGKRKVWIEPLFAEAKQWHGMRRFRLRQLWRVNCEALMIASGQNLKRLLQKRGWGRRPFPAQAMALMPPESFEAETWSRNLPLKNQRASVAVASFASWGVVRGFFEAKINLFSLINGVIVVSAFNVANIIFVFLTFLYCSTLIHLDRETFWPVKLMFS